MIVTIGFLVRHQHNPMGIEIIGLFITYSPIVRLILLHFPEQLIVPPYATII
jgi:hypothetical protein